MVDVRDKAKELAEAIVTSEEFKKLEEAREVVNKHEAARIMLRDFQAKQEALQKQQYEGTPVTDSQAEDLRKLYEVLTINPYIRTLFEAEFRFGGMMMEVQEIISKALGFLEDSEEEQAQTIEVPKKKLWTPNS